MQMNAKMAIHTRKANFTKPSTTICVSFAKEEMSHVIVKKW